MGTIKSNTSFLSSVRGQNTYKRRYLYPTSVSAASTIGGIFWGNESDPVFTCFTRQHISRLRL